MEKMLALRVVEEAGSLMPSANAAARSARSASAAPSRRRRRGELAQALRQGHERAARLPLSTVET